MYEDVRNYPLHQIFSKNLIFLMLSLIIFSGCDKELSEIDENKVLRKISAQEQEIIHSNNQLSLDILRAEYQLNQNENVLFSPLSVGISLGMVYNGVGEKEKSEIQQLLGLESLAEKEINKSYNELLSFLQVSYNELNISYANSLWFSQDINIHEDFRTRVMAYYDAEVSELNFKKSSSLEIINSWGNMKSNGSFEKLIDVTPLKNTEIFLVNAFSLNSDWKQKDNYFQSKRDFYTYKGEKFKVDMIQWDGLNIKLNENSNYDFMEIPFENDQFSFAVIQPENQESLSKVMESISIDELDHLIDNSMEYKANVSLPHINFYSDRPLKNVLSSIGLKDLFLSTTDLSPAFIEKNKKISEINHLARINLKSNEYSIRMEDSFADSNLKLVNINRPFLYFIRDKHSKTILFAGYYTQPGK